jgi:hypothetical protein
VNATLPPPRGTLLGRSSSSAIAVGAIAINAQAEKAANATTLKFAVKRFITFTSVFRGIYEFA